MDGVTNPPVPATPLDVEACVRLLERQAELAANRSAADRDYAERHEGTHPHHAAEYHATAAKYMEEAKLLRALASALPGMGKDSATVAALTAENERQAKAISFAVGWLGAMLERRQYEDDHELREMQGMLAAAQVVEVK